MFVAVFLELAYDTPLLYADPNLYPFWLDLVDPDGEKLQLKLDVTVALSFKFAVHCDP